MATPGQRMIKVSTGTRVITTDRGARLRPRDLGGQAAVGARELRHVHAHALDARAGTIGPPPGGRYVEASALATLTTCSAVIPSSFEELAPGADSPEAIDPDRGAVEADVGRPGGADRRLDGDAAPARAGQHLFAVRRRLAIEALERLANIGKPSVTRSGWLLLRRCRLPGRRGRRGRERLGANQAGAPYSEHLRHRRALPEPPRHQRGLLQQGRHGELPGRRSNANPSQGCPDGYQQLEYPYSGSDPPGTTASPCGGTTATTRSSTQATSTCAVGQPHRRQHGARRTLIVQQWNASAGLVTSIFNANPGQQLDPLRRSAPRPSASARGPATAPASC